MEFSNLIAPTEMKELIKLQNKVAEDKKNKTDKLKGIRSNMQVVTDSLASVGIKKSPKGDNKEYFEAFGYIEHEISIEQERLGRNLTSQEVQAVADRSVTNVRSNGGWFSDKKRIYQLEDKDAYKYKVYSVSDISKSERREIEAALAAGKMPVNDTNILQLYNNKIKNQSGIQKWDDLVRGKK